MVRSVVTLPVEGTSDLFQRGSVTVVPSAPTLQALQAPEQVDLSWTSVANATGYKIFWDTSTGVSQTDNVIDISSGATLSYSHTGRANGTTYYYKIAAVGAWGVTALSSEVNATPSSLTSTKSVLFDGVDEYVVIGSQADIQFEITDPLTFSAWVKRASDTGFPTLLTNDYGGTVHGYLWRITDAHEVELQIFNSGATQRIRVITATNSLKVADGWTHIVVTYDGSKAGSGVTLYKNAVDVTDSIPNDSWTDGSSQKTDAWRIGRRASGYFDGNIDEVAIYNIELTAAQVSEIYNSGSPNDLTNTSFSDPIHWWRMGEGDTFPTLADQVQSLDGTMTNMESGDIEEDAP